MKIILKRILFFIDKLIKKENIIIFTSFKEMTDNSFAIYKYLSENNYNYRLIWIKDSNNKSLNLNKNIEIYPFKSFKGIYYYLKSKYIFGTHGLYSIFPKNKNRIRINLWHGMPLKLIGNLDNRGKKSKSKDDYIISTSEYFQEIMSEVFGVDKEKVIITGQPRNDLFFEETNYFFKNNIDKNKYKKILIWLPTFRNSTVNSNSTWAKDGKYQENYISVLPFEKLKELNELLEKKQFLLIIKLHPFDILQNEKFEKFSNIIILKSEDLEKTNEQLYPLLGSTDALITDYSSVWIDYEILDKPIFFAIHDYEEYKNTRGLLFEDFIDISPYSVIKNYEEFIKFIENYEQIDMNNRKFTDKYNKYKDNKSCERIIRYIGLEKNEK